MWITPVVITLHLRCQLRLANYLSDAIFFSVSNNNLNGTIHQSICRASYLQVLDLSNNSLHGTIPSCFTHDMINKTLGVLNLRKNNLSDNIPEILFHEYCDLEILDVSENLIQGRVPKFLANRKKLMFLNLGSNKINDIDTYPCWLKNFSNLRVLVLRSNSFHGSVSCLGYTTTTCQIFRSWT